MRRLCRWALFVVSVPVLFVRYTMEELEFARLRRKAAQRRRDLGLQ